MRTDRRVVTCLILALLCSPSCGGGATSSGGGEGQLRTLVSLYVQAITQLGRRPKSEAEFKSFIAKNGGPILEARQIANADDLFVSPRDSQPYVVIYGTPPKGASPSVVAYEQTGVDGKRQVGFDLRNVSEVDEAKFRELVPTGSSSK